MLKQSFICCAAVFLIASCAKDKAIEPAPCENFPTVVSYSNDIVPIINKSCGSSTNCHAPGASGGQPIYDDYAAIKEKVDDGKLHQRVIEQRDMPAPWGPDSVQITDCERELFRLWIEAGAPNN